MVDTVRPGALMWKEKLKQSEAVEVSESCEKIEDPESAEVSQRLAVSQDSESSERKFLKRQDWRRC